MGTGAACMLLSAFAFSVMTALVKLAGERLPSQEIVVARALVSLLLTYALLRRAGVSPWGEQRAWLWLRGLFGFAGLSCVFAAVTHLPLAEATVLQYLHPAITAVLAALFLERAMEVMAGLKRHMGLIERAMGVLLLAVGLMMVTGAFSDLSYWLLETFPALGLIG